MKKLALLIACLMLVTLLLPSCGAKMEKASEDAPDGEYTVGTISENRYSSDWLGLEFVPAEGVTLLSRDDLNAQMNSVAVGDAGQFAVSKTVNEMMAVNTKTQGEVLVVTEKLEDGKMKMADYVNVVKNKINGIASVKYENVTNEEIAGKTFVRLSFTLSEAGIEVRQTMYMHKIGDRMLVITVMAENRSTEDALIACFKAK